MTFWDRFIELIAWMPADIQDAVILFILVLPTIITGIIVTRGYRPLSLVRSMLIHFRWANLAFIILIALSVGTGVALISQERALQEGTARAAAPFDLVVAAPGSDITIMLATVFLQPSAVPLLPGSVYDRVARTDGVTLAAPIAFGDSFRGYPVVGSTIQFVEHLSGRIRDGAGFNNIYEAVVGARVDLALGDRFSPAHGVGAVADDHAHSHVDFEVVGRMTPTGSPWDRAIIVPVEAVWAVHGLASGHAPESANQIGPPFDPDYFPGTPAILVTAQELYMNYALRSQFTTPETMAFFPGSVLSRLYSLMGEVREMMSAMAVLTQVLIATSVFCGQTILLKLFSRRIALLRAIGAPSRYVFAAVWWYALALTAIGALVGIGVGQGAATLVSQVVSARTDISLAAGLGWQEVHLVAGFVSVTALIALLPASMAMRRSAIADLRTH